MDPAEPSQIRPSALEGTRRVDDKVPRDCRMKPQRLPLITVQSSVRAEASRQGLDLASTKPSLCWASLGRQQSLVAQVDDVLARRTQDGRGLPGSDQIAANH
jgi:hypothetical protein